MTNYAGISNSLWKTPLPPFYFLTPPSSTLNLTSDKTHKIVQSGELRKVLVPVKRCFFLKIYLIHAKQGTNQVRSVAKGAYKGAKGAQTGVNLNLGLLSLFSEG